MRGKKTGYDKFWTVLFAELEPVIHWLNKQANNFFSPRFDLSLLGELVFLIGKSIRQSSSSQASHGYVS
jgi:hypothetical protein